MLFHFNGAAENRQTHPFHPPPVLPLHNFWPPPSTALESYRDQTPEPPDSDVNTLVPKCVEWDVSIETTKWQTNTRFEHVWNCPLPWKCCTCLCFWQFCALTLPNSSVMRVVSFACAWELGMCLRAPQILWLELMRMSKCHNVSNKANHTMGSYSLSCSRMLPHMIHEAKVLFIPGNHSHVN